MTERSIVHSSFTLERRYAATPEQVFEAWSDPAVKARWFAPPPAQHDLDLRIDGRERVRAEFEGRVMTFTAVYDDVVPAERLVFTGRLASDGQLATVSITTVEFRPYGRGTHLVLTELDAYLDGHEQPEWRESGTSDWLDRLTVELGGGDPAAAGS